MGGKYILDEHGEPAPCEDVLVWGKWFEQDERRVVRRNTFMRDGTEITVSTVFLGLNHNWRAGPPTLWETMIFGMEDEQQWRCASREEAIANHERLVADLVNDKE